MCGLNAKVVNGARVHVMVDGQKRETKDGVHFDHESGLRDSGLDSIAATELTRTHRLIEFLYSENYPIEHIANVSRLTKKQVELIIERRFTFDIHWEDSFHFLLKDFTVARIEVELWLPVGKESKKYACLAKLPSAIEASSIAHTPPGGRVHILEVTSSHMCFKEALMLKDDPGLDLLMGFSLASLTMPEPPSTPKN